jgi:hypothetical protein
MGNLKPIGSEKLTGQDKINRIIEIARFNEVSPNKLNESSKSDYSVVLADNYEYHIVKEKQGYIIKKSITESEIDYIEPMKNRKYFSSYSQAFKRLNLLAGELNRLNENEQGVSLFGEQKKFVLKTPKPQPQEPELPSEPPAVPSPELPSGDMPAEDMPAGDDIELPDAGQEDMPLPDQESDDMSMGDDMPDSDDSGQVSFKTIQKLTGKLTQKVRTLEDQDGMSSEDIKYVINMVLSSLNLSELSEEDREDIISKFEGEEDMGDEDLDMEDDMGDEDLDMGDDLEGGSDLPEPEIEEPAESKYGGAILDSIFSESKVDKVLSKYFETTKKEINESKKINETRLIERKFEVKKLMKDVIRLSETIEQELASQKFLEKNKNFIFVGKTNKKNLVFESTSGQIKISPEGSIL